MKNLKYLLLVFALYGCQQEQLEVELIVVETKIWTGNPAQPFAEAMAIDGDRIVDIGTMDDISKYWGGDTEIQTYNGRFIVPGFIDSHVHFLTGGQNLSSVQLRDAATREEFIKRIANYAATLQPGEWILGGDWDHKLWGGELPAKEWIDSVTAENPMLINRLDGHMALANSAALDFFGITAATSYEAGDVWLGVDGQPTGLLKEDAYYLQTSKIPPFAPEQDEEFVKAAMNYVASFGVTSVHDVNGFHDQEVFERLKQKNELITRIYSATPLSQWQRLEAKIDSSGRGNHWLKIGGLKGFVDGSLGSHTAAFFDDYADTPGERGYFVNSKEDLYKWILGADDAELQVMVHAIGDSANHELLDVYEQVANKNGPRDRRFRIEHTQHLLPSDYSRFAELGVIPSMQPYHAIDDGRWAEEVIGPERIKSTYAFHSLIDAGADLAFGSDWFVAPPIPLMGIYAAVTRKTLDGANPGGWVPEQKISVEEALRAYTWGGAYASFEEDIKGSLEAGKLADFAVLDRNLFEIDADSIRHVKVMATYVGGKKVYERKQAE